MGLFGNKNKDGVLSTNLIFNHGVDSFFKGEIIELSLNEEERKVIIKSRVDKKKPLVNLSVDKINRAQFISEKEIIEKQKSVGGRAVVGGLLLGPIGAVVGGMTGINSKKKSEITNYFVINYNDDKVLSFEIPPMNLNFSKVLKAINSYQLVSNTDIEL